MKKLLRVFAIFLFAVSGSRLAIAIDIPTGVFYSGNVPINVDVFKPTGAGVHPTVIFLGGADGMSIFPWNYTSMGSWFASQGYNFFIVHYFDRTGTVFADPLTTYKDFGPWVQVINDATTWAGSQTGVDPQKIGLMGLSLGSSLAISDASKDQRIKALVDWEGSEATWYEFASNTSITRMPPTLILQGDADQVNPVANAYALQALLQRLGTPSQMKIYPGEGHVFNAKSEMDVLQVSAAFFQTYFGH